MITVVFTPLLIFAYFIISSDESFPWMLLSFNGQISATLREHLRTQKAVPYLSHSFLYFIYFIHEFHVQIINFVYNKVK